MVYKVLLADKSATIQKLVEMALSDSEYQLLSVSDGKQAIEQLGEFNPDVILADASMNHLDGYQVCEHVRGDDRFSRIPVVLLIGRFQPFDEARASAAGVNEKVVKPFSKEQLVNVLQQLLQQAASEADTAPMPETAPPPIPEPELEPELEPEMEMLDEVDEEPAPSSSGDFDEGATVAISPEQMRAHLQSLDTGGEEEMPSIDDFDLGDDDDEIAVEDDLVLEPDSEDVISPDPELESLAEPEHEPMPELEPLPEPDLSTEPDLEPLPEFDTDDEPMELHTEDLDEVELEDIDDVSFDTSEIEEHETLPNLEAEEEAEDVDLPDLNDSDSLSDDSIEELHLEDSGADLEPLEIEELPEFDEPEAEPDLGAGDDTQPVKEPGSVDLDQISFEDSEEIHLDESDDTLDGEDFQLEGEDDLIEDDEPIGFGGEDTQPVSPFSEPIEDLAEATELAEDEPLLEVPEEPAMVEEPLGADGDLELELEEDFEETITGDQDSILEIEEEAEPFSDASTMKIPTQEIPPEEEALHAETIRSDTPLVDPIATNAPDPVPGLDMDEEETVDMPAMTSQDEPEPEPIDVGNETIRVEEPVLAPEEEAYFADTVRADEPLITRAEAMAASTVEEEQSSQSEAPAPQAAAPATGNGSITDQQLDKLADMVTERLIERLGDEQIRDIVWQVVPELAEAMIKKRIYQLEQSVDAE